jgi:hypothetical protein
VNSLYRLAPFSPRPGQFYFPPRGQFRLPFPNGYAPRPGDSRHRCKTALPDLLDTLKAIPVVGGGVLLIVLGAEVPEVALEYSMELVVNNLEHFEPLFRNLRATCEIYRDRPSRGLLASLSMRKPKTEWVRHKLQS